MIQRRRRLSFGPEPFKKSGVVDQALMQKFDGNFATQGDIFGQIDLSRGSGTDRGNQSISLAEYATDLASHAGVDH